MKNKKILIGLLIVLIVLVIGLVILLLPKKGEAPANKPTSKVSFIDNKTNDFNIRLLQYANSVNPNTNYLISPYSIEMALAMVKEGSNGDTLKQIEEMIGKRNIKDVSNNYIKVSNGIFVKDTYKKIIEAKFNKALKSKFKSEVLYDAFKSPDVINEWVKQKTDGMIPTLMDDISDEFVLALVNAIAIDVKWQSKFECNNTYEEEFTKKDNSKLKVEMMHSTYSNESYKYIKDKEVEGIILPYEEGTNLEFIAIKPKNIDEYINNLTGDKLNKTIDGAKASSENVKVNLSIPRFTYDYTFAEFKQTLELMGMKDAFDKNNANFTKIITKDNMTKSGMTNLYINKAIHKTHIELSETGTKAAAVTGFTFDKANSAPESNIKYVDIELNKTFMYIIRNTNTKEMLFVGVVDSPNKWNGSTCSNKE